MQRGDVATQRRIECVLPQIRILRRESLGQRLHFGQGGAELQLALAPQQHTGEDFPDQPQSVDDRVRPVHLEEVDVVDAERLETLVESLAKPVRARIPDEAVVGHPQAALGRHADR